MRPLDSNDGLPAPIEREIKFSLDARTARRLRHDPALRSTEPEIVSQVSEYWDTDTADLRAAGLSLRLRHFGDRTVQTVKTTCSPATGWVGRFEDETEIDGDEPVLNALARHASPERILAIKGRLRPQFRVTVERVRWRLEHAGARFSVDLDEGIIEAGDKRAPLRELEVELLEGPVPALFAFARELVGRLRLAMEFCTKSDRGFGLLADHDCRYRRLQDHPLDPELSRADAFRALAMAAVRSFALHAKNFTTRSQAEAIHGMRVALRRLRTLLRFDRDLFTREERAAINRDIIWLFDGLGKARNLDIVIAEMRRWPRSALPEGALKGLLAERTAAYREVAAMLHSRRCRSGLIDLVAFIECGDWAERAPNGEPAPSDMSAQKAARHTLRRSWKAVTGAKRPSRLSPAPRHRLRIHAKRLRYGCDFYAGLFPEPKAAERCARMREVAVALQDALGVLNDKATLAALIAGKLPDLAVPASAEEVAADAATLRAADKAHRRLADCKPFWK